MSLCLKKAPVCTIEDYVPEEEELDAQSPVPTVTTPFTTDSRPPRSRIGAALERISPRRSPRQSPSPRRSPRWSGTADAQGDASARSSMPAASARSAASGASARNSAPAASTSQAAVQQAAPATEVSRPQSDASQRSYRDSPQSQRPVSTGFSGTPGVQKAAIGIVTIRIVSCRSSARDLEGLRLFFVASCGQQSFVSAVKSTTAPTVGAGSSDIGWDEVYHVHAQDESDPLVITLWGQTVDGSEQNILASLSSHVAEIKAQGRFDGWKTLQRSADSHRNTSELQVNFQLVYTSNETVIATVADAPLARVRELEDQLRLEMEERQQAEEALMHLTVQKEDALAFASSCNIQLQELLQSQVTPHGDMSNQAQSPELDVLRSDSAAARPPVPPSLPVPPATTDLRKATAAADRTASTETDERRPREIRASSVQANKQSAIAAGRTGAPLWTKMGESVSSKMGQSVSVSKNIYADKKDVTLPYRSLRLFERSIGDSGIEACAVCVLLLAVPSVACRYEARAGMSLHDLNCSVLLAGGWIHDWQAPVSVAVDLG